jgi:hypothetical protein
MYDIPYGDKLSKNADALGQYWRDIQGMSNDIKPGHLLLFRAAQKGFCSNIDNYLLTAGDKTCKDLDTERTQAKEYCSKDDRIATSTCGKETLKSWGAEDIYNELAEKYCDDNPDKDFCACYNVTQPGLCEQLPNLPGCKTVKPVWDKITSSLDEGDIAQFEGMQPCYGSVCSGNVYQPTSWDANCNRDISICKADFDIGGDLVGSNISLKQDCGKEGSNGETTTENKDGDGDEKKSLTEKLFKFEEDKDKKLIEKQSTKIFGTVSSVSSCFMCMAALILFT